MKSSNPQRRSPVVLKRFLRDECLPTLCKWFKYFDIETLRQSLRTAQIESTPETLKRYMVEMENDGFVFDAGRGWYSGIAVPYKLDTNPLREIDTLLKQQFPFLLFSCWSTMQLNPYMHHLLAKYVTFVHVDKDLMSSVFEFMRERKDMTVYQNPSTRKEREEFRVTENTVVVRPSVTGAPGEGHFAPIEKILVDLAVEVAKLPLMGTDELIQMARRVVTESRISIGALLRYAGRRNLDTKMIFGANNQLMSNMQQN